MPKKGVKIDPYANGAEKSYFSKQVFPSSSKQNICNAKNIQDILPSFGLILSKKVEFCQTFTIQAPLEIQDTIE